MNERIYNFNPGPAVLPEDVLREVQAELLNFRGTGMSILETSHRAPAYDEVHQQAKADIKELMGLGDDYDVVFTAGGASQSFALIPLNFAGKEHPGSYALSGSFAQKAYEEAGYSKDKPLKVELFYNTNDNHKKIAVAIASMWKQNLGVETELVNQEWKVFLNRRQNKETQVFRAGWIADYNDPYSFLELFGKASGLNDVGLDDAKYNELLEQASGEADPKKRFEQLAAAEKILVDDFAVMPIYTYVAKQLVKPYVKGFENNILNRHPSRFISIEKK